MHIIIKGVRGDSWLTPKAKPNYLSSILSSLTTYHLLRHLSVGAGSCALIRWVGFIRPHPITGSYPINLRGEESPPLRFYYLSFLTYSIEAIASLSSSRLNFPDFTASIIDLGDAEILALAPDFLLA